MKFCECGCGLPTRQAPYTDPQKKWKRGEWLRFRRGHNGRKGPVADRIRNGVEIDSNGCWIWRGHVAPDGYGTLSIGGRPFRAHRVAYEAFVGKLSDGELVCHKCDVRSCCNPGHLFSGSQADNIADMMSKGRHSCGERPRGTKSPAAKLDDEKIRQIKSLAHSGIGPRELGRRFGVSHAAIRAILLGKTWSHVQPRLPSGESE